MLFGNCLNKISNCFNVSRCLSHLHFFAKKKKDIQLCLTASEDCLCSSIATYYIRNDKVFEI